ncbi:MAG: ABC transporter substrate-binding protein [Bacilli bacterium]|nr:ABC transporter substrate-binding protein [Bacilli bacterium]
MPEMTFEWALKENNINKEDLTIDTSIAFASMQGAFVGGIGDFVTLFEPNATQVEKEGFGYVVASVGELGGIVPYTSYSARKSYIEENSNVIESFDKAVNMGLTFVLENDSETVAKSISSFFPDTSLNDLIKVIDRYKEIKAWPNSTIFKEESFNHLQDIMINANELDEKVPYEDLIYLK